MSKYNSQAHPAPLTWGDLLEGTAQLATNGMIEITDLVEAIHKEVILRPFFGLSESPVHFAYENTAGKFYQIIKQMMRFSGGSSADILRLLNQHLKEQQQQTQLPERLKILLNTVNGVMGDHLVMQDNPLAAPMLFYNRYGKLHKSHRVNSHVIDSLHASHSQKKEKLSGRVIILVHGLCMSFYSWLPGKQKGLGEHLIAEIPNTTILHLDYNTGKRISENGHMFTKLLEDLVDNNPDIEHIDLIGHSMGGLVSRSAIFYAKQEQKAWLDKVDNYISLGSPHHGALLEKVGFFLQDNLSKVPIAGNLAHLLDIRSAGIIDLRHGSIRHDDWQTLEERTGLVDDSRRPAPLPSNINAYLVASTLNRYKKLSHNLQGDGLVSVSSALAENTGNHDLNVPESHKALFYGINHINIHYHKRVRKQIIKWINMPQDQKKSKSKRIVSFIEEKSRKTSKAM